MAPSPLESAIGAPRGNIGTATSCEPHGTFDSRIAAIVTHVMARNLTIVGMAAIATVPAYTACDVDGQRGCRRITDYHAAHAMSYRRARDGRQGMSIRLFCTARNPLIRWNRV